MGFFGRYKIWIHVINHPEDATNPKAWKAAPDVHLEAYYLSAPSLPDFFKDGIPLLLLRMFALPHEHRLNDDSAEPGFVTSQKCALDRGSRLMGAHPTQKITG
jgi:hypothetical protein